MEDQDKSSFVQSRLPWLVAAAALVVYLFTLNRWVSLASLPTVSAVGSENLIPPINGPLTFLLFLPFRWLPVAWQSVALNVFTALCASLTLGLLARSVALLPHDRTREQRQRERSENSLLSIPAAWAPPLFAVAACGLQLTFWEHAIAATGEMLDLLLFAYVVRCLLEFRVDQRESWLMRSALVFGIAMTNNYAMIGFFPVYLAALIWIKGLSFFEFRFVARMFGWGAAGLTLYLLLPALNALNDQANVSFWQALRFELAGQKGALFGFPRYLVLIAGLTSLLPLLFVAIRWPSTFGETSPAGAVIAAFMFRLVHALFLAVGIWVAFGAPFGPRMLMERLLEQVGAPSGGVPFLTFYYSGALCLGYFAGYFLLVCGHDGPKTWQRSSAGARLMSRVTAAAVWIAVIGTPIGLVYRNAQPIRAGNGSLLRTFARLATLHLPAHEAIALSDDPFILSLAQRELQQSRAKEDPIVVDTRMLKFAPYQQSLHDRFPLRWPPLPPSDAGTQNAVFDSRYLVYELSGLTRSNAVYYMHPSFGYYFEALYPRPHGLLYQLELYPTDTIVPPPLTDAEIAENQRFWSGARPTLDQLKTLVRNGVRDARAVGRWYSRALDSWGVELQKAGRLPEAGQAFELARALNPQNVAAEANLGFNEQLREKKTKSPETNKSLEEKFGRYRDWNALLAVNGPIDDPDVGFRLGQTLTSQSLFRQAALQFIRVLELRPDNQDARFWLANVFLAWPLPDKALEVAQEIRARAASQPLSLTNQIDLARIQATAYFKKGETNTAEKLLLKAREDHPQNEAVLDTLVQFYTVANRLTNALATLEEQLRLKPDNIPALLNKAYICMRLESYDAANAAIAAVLKKDPENVQALLDKGAVCIQTKQYKDAMEPLNRVLNLQTNNLAALMNRAIAHLQSDQLDAAERDYVSLQKLMPTMAEMHRVYYGLGEIAFRRKDVPVAIKQYEAYLKFAPPNSEEAKQVVERLNRLKELASH